LADSITASEQENIDANVIMDNIDEELIKTIEKDGIFPVDLTNPEINKVYKKYGKDFKDLAVRSVKTKFGVVHKGKWTETIYKKLKIKIIDKVDTELKNINPEHEAVPITFNCVVLGVDQRKAYVKSATVQCPQCSSIDFIRADKDRGLRAPRCWNGSCRGVTMIIVPKDLKTGYIQTVVIQEPMEDVRKNSPVIFSAKLLDWDVGEAYMGQKKRITGMFKTVVTDSKKNEYEINIEVIDMTDLDDVKLVMPPKEDIEKWKKDKDEKDYLDKVIQSYAPHILGHRNIKLSILLQLVGGSKNKNIREWINLFLVGDPGVAKTELLKFGELCTQKSVYTTGKGTTAAGLTAGMVKQANGTSILQAGVYPLCNNGYAYVDEFDKMSHEDQSVMHTVMEHGEVNRAVAGINVSLPAKVPTLAAANPKYGAYDEKLTLIENIQVPTPLLTRFDMIWLMRDKVDNIMDTKKAQHILETFRGERKESESYLNLKQLLGFINYCKHIQPVLTEETEQKLIKFYNTLRGATKGSENEMIPINPRHLQSLVRLSTAHAKLFFRDKVTVEDVDCIIELYKDMLLSFGKKLEDDGFVQVDLQGSKKLDMEHQFEECWRAVADKKGSVSESELYTELQAVYNWDSKKFNKKIYEMRERKGEIYVTDGRLNWKMQ